MYLWILFDLLVVCVFLATLTYYFITNLQWYSYSLGRVITKHHKWQWHCYYFILPILCFIILRSFFAFLYVDILILIAWIPLFWLWYSKLDKKLVWTSRVMRFFTLNIIMTILCYIFAWYVFYQFWYVLDRTLEYVAFIQLNVSDFFFLKAFMTCIILCAIPISYCLSVCIESILFSAYANRAKNKLQNLSNLTIIAITGSYGKTSTKNFIAQILSEQFRVYATPRSVNTYKGLVGDINQNLNAEYEIYIAEAGARNKGDIAEISNLLQQHYGVIGKVGNAHIEYFGNIQTTLHTKFEMLYSERLIKAFVQKDNEIPKDIPQAFIHNLEKILRYPPNVKIRESSLEKTAFTLELDSVFVEFETNVLGQFNIDNISVAILLAKTLGMDLHAIQKAVMKLQPIPHRLQKITTADKIILDDSFNGNLEGMSEAIRLSSLYQGRKVIVTPGLVESDEQSNIILAQKIDEVFDVAILTGTLNIQTLDKHILKAQKILLKDKAELESILVSSGQRGDLVLFANDAPNYI